MPSHNCCSNCEYYLHPKVCNAFALPTDNPLAANECSEWVKKDHYEEGQRKQELQARVQRPRQQGYSLVVMDNLNSPERLTEEQIAEARIWAGEMRLRRFRDEYPSAIVME